MESVDCPLNGSVAVSRLKPRTAGRKAWLVVPRLLSRVDAANEWRTHDLAFPSQKTKQLDHKISIRKSMDMLKSFVQMDIFRSVVAEAGESRQYRIVPEQGVAQYDFTFVTVSSRFIA